MAYFLKQTTLKGRTYLSITESFYNPQKKGTSHKTLKSLGSVETWKAKGLDDPVVHFQKEVDALNGERESLGVRLISDVSPNLYLGYFPFKAILDKLKIKKYVDYFKLANDFEYDLYQLISTLIYARAVNPCSKYRTFHEVLPELFDSSDYSYDQLLDGLSFIGNDYEKFIEIFSVQTNAVYGLDTHNTYFDCTNFFFEIDKEDIFRKKGPSKENKKDPIVGLGLLLDSNQLPIGMMMYPGNQSEKPVFREVLKQLKKRNNISGRTIHVADKGLNCSQNITFLKENGDGYLFSKSVKSLSEKEKVWVLLDKGFKAVKDRAGNIIYYFKSCIDEFPYTIEYKNKKTTLNFTEKRLLTYNPDLAAKKRYEINKMVEKAKSLTLSQAKKSDYGETGKYVSFTNDKGEKANVTINQIAIDKDLKFAGYNLLVTSETSMSDSDMYNTYHNLWRIEESFKVMKSDLDARPVFLQKEDTIKGHFLICYLTVLLERIFQFKVLDNKYSTNDIFRFIKGFKVINVDNRYINITKSTDFIKELAIHLNLPLTNYHLTERQIKAIHNYSL